MKTAYLKELNETQLAALNASVEAELVDYADDWTDSAVDTELDCGILYGSHGRDRYDD
jgi:hypothetical protein